MYDIAKRDALTSRKTPFVYQQKFHLLITVNGFDTRKSIGGVQHTFNHAHDDDNDQQPKYSLLNPKKIDDKHRKEC
ncbi:hypothetical protein HMPREF1254_1863 [Prevotella sp. BV3P1]|nr:hypothetical protein HMPREF1254_1863 [Prevotella sp. BV3P1]